MYSLRCTYKETFEVPDHILRRIQRYFLDSDQLCSELNELNGSHKLGRPFQHAFLCTN